MRQRRMATEAPLKAFHDSSGFVNAIPAMSKAAGTMIPSSMEVCDSSCDVWKMRGLHKTLSINSVGK